MNEEEKTVFVAAAVIGLAIASVPALLNRVGSRRRKEMHNKRIATIKAWEADRLACVKNSEERILRMAEQGASAEQIWTAVREEQAFLNIVINDPPC